jgi:hypothetical protein
MDIRLLAAVRLVAGGEALLARSVTRRPVGTSFVQPLAAMARVPMASTC